MLNIIIIFFTIGILMALHELGHFLLAKLFKIRVDEFGIGYPPRLVGKKFGETIYSLNAVPFGAFVRIDEEDRTSPTAFSSKPVWQRMLVILGGVVSFWIISAFLLTITFSIGGTIQAISDDETGFDNAQIRIISVAPDSPAKAAGLEAMDVILKIGLKDSGEEIYPQKAFEVQDFIQGNKGRELIFSVLRQEKEREFSLVPRENFPEGEGPTGVSLARTANIIFPWWQAPVKAVKATAFTTYYIVVSLAEALIKAVRGIPTGVQVSGPIGVGSMMNQALGGGIGYFIQFVAIISAHLAVFNLLPFPVFDGGKAVFLFIEALKKKALDKNIERKINNVSYALIIALMVWITIKDIISLFQ